VNYVGFQPGDANLPLVTSKNGTVGAPGVLNNGTPTTAVSNLTSNSFTLAFDYRNNVFGTDVLTLGNNLASINVNVTFPSLVVTGTTNAMTVSEYSTQATFQPPVTVSGGLAPYTLSPSGTSDPRFTIQNNQIVVNVASLPVSQTTSCQVVVLVVDSAGNSGTATGTIQVTVMAETFITVNFTNASFNLNVSAGLPLTQFDIPNQTQSVPVLFHSPAQFFVDSVTLPQALVGFVSISPTQRVLAVNVNNNNTSAVISDVNSSLANDGTFIAPAVPFANAPATGTYTVPLTLRVVDAKNITLSQAVTLSVVIS
jgi:hypothetical protein